MDSSQKNYSDSFIRMNNSSFEKPLISIIIVNYNGFEYTRTAVKSVLRFSPNSEIIVVDNHSTDGSPDLLAKEFRDIQVVPLKENRGFGYGNNRGAESARNKFLFFLNNDTYLTEDTPSALAAVLEGNENIGACGPKLLNADSSYQLSMGFDPSIKNEWAVRRMQQRVRNRDTAYVSRLERRFGNNDVDWLTGAALMVRKVVFDAVGGFDEGFFLYFEDADLCRRIRERGYAIKYVPTSSLVHLLGRSSDEALHRISQEYRKSQVRYYRKHASAVSLWLLRLYLKYRIRDSI